MISGTTQVTAPIAPTSLIDLYPTHDAAYGFDGLRNVATVSARNAIPDLRRRAGMIVGVLADDTYWRLKNITWDGTSSDWEQFLLGNYVPYTEKGAINGVATLDGAGKIPIAQLASSVMQYQGQWNASTNSPSLIDGTGDTGDVWEVTVAGTQNLGSGALTFKVGDWVVYDGSVWERSINSNEVVSVNGFTGAVTLTTSNIAEGTNLYYTDLRVDTYMDSVNAMRGVVTQNQIAYGDSNGDLQGNVNFLFNGTNMSIGLALASARMHIKGTDSTSANYSLKIDNSSDVNLLSLANDGLTTIGATGGSSRVRVNLGDAQSFNINATDNAVFSMSDNNSTWFTIAPTVFNEASLYSTGILDIAGGGAGTVYTRYSESAGGIGVSTVNPSARFHIKGAGATSATYSLKLDNSNDASLFYVRNDAYTKIGYDTNTTITRALDIVTNHSGATSVAIKNDVISALFLYNISETEETLQIAGYHGVGGVIKVKNSLFFKNYTNDQFISGVKNVDTNPNWYFGNHLGTGDSSNDARIRIIGQDVTSSNFSLKIVDSNLSELFYVRNDGNITVKQDPTVALGVATKQYVDNSISVTGGVIDITYASLATLKSVNGLVKGKSYRITNRFVGYTHGDDRGIVIVMAIDTNKLAKEAIRIMYCPSFYDASIDIDGNDWIGVWHSSKAVSTGQLSIWGGKVWENLTGIIGTSIDSITLDGTNWSLVDKSVFVNNEYIDVQFKIFYDFDNDWVEKQYDKSGNIIGIDNYTYVNSSITYNPCDITDWNFIAGRNAGTSYFNENNVPYGIFNNTGNVITDNECAMVEAIRNNTALSITYNHIFGIYENIGQTEISKNYVSHIYSNTNTGKITSNDLNRNEISYNDNNVINILENTNTGNISYNSNTGNIKYNHNLGSISDNSNLGDISNCTDEIQQDIANLLSFQNKLHKNQLTNDIINGNPVYTCQVIDNGINFGIFAPFIKKVYIISVNPTETVNYIYCDALPKNNKVILEVEAGLEVTFIHGTGTDEIRLEGGSNTYVNGTYGEWIEIEKTDLDIIRQSNIAAYI